MFHALRQSSLSCAYLLAAETLFLVIGNPRFLLDVGSAAVGVLGAYAVFATVVGAIAGAATRNATKRMVAGLAPYYVAISLKVVAIDAGQMRNPLFAAAFLVVSVALFLALRALAQRTELGAAACALLILGYFVVCKMVQLGWATSGGRPLVFLTSLHTLATVGLGGLIVAVGVGGTLWIERAKSRRARSMIPAFVLVFLGAAILQSTRFDPPVVPRVQASGRAPDIYVLSIDALRSDALASYLAAHPQGRLRFLVDHGTRFGNVVSHGVATYDVLANNTFAHEPRTCASSIPELMHEQGYRTVMLLGRYGRRISGADCYDRYFSGGGNALARQYVLPRLFHAATAPSSLRSNFIPSAELVDELRSEIAGASKQPLYAYLHLLDLHSPYIPSSRAHDPAYLDDLRAFVDDCYLVACEPGSAVNAKHIASVRAAYDEAIADIELQIDAVFRVAEEHKRTFMLVLTADHGELFGEHGGFAHSGGFVPELLDVPFVVYDSRSPNAGSRCDLVLTSALLRSVAKNANAGAVPASGSPSDLELVAPPLGTARISATNQTILFRVADNLVPHTGTWRNIHRQQTGQIPYPIEACTQATSPIMPNDSSGLVP